MRDYLIKVIGSSFVFLWRLSTKRKIGGLLQKGMRKLWEVWWLCRVFRRAVSRRKSWRRWKSWRSRLLWCALYSNVLANTDILVQITRNTVLNDITKIRRDARAAKRQDLLFAKRDLLDLSISYKHKCTVPSDFHCLLPWVLYLVPRHREWLVI